MDGSSAFTFGKKRASDIKTVFIIDVNFVACVAWIVWFEKKLMTWMISST
jgi:hypothetical protein